MGRQEWTHKVGILAPSTDTTVEVDMYTNLPSSISVHTARMLMKGVTIEDEEEMLRTEVPEAADRIATIDPDLVLFACTSAGSLHGVSGDAELAERIRKRAGSRVVTVFGSVLEELRQCGSERLFVFTPYCEEINDRLAASLAEGGVDVGSIWGLGITSDTAIGRLDPREILRLVVKETSKRRADYVFVSCTNLRSWEVLAEARNRLGIPVVCSNYLAYKTILAELGYTEGEGR